MIYVLMRLEIILSNCMKNWQPLQTVRCFTCNVSDAKDELLTPEGEKEKRKCKLHRVTSGRWKKLRKQTKRPHTQMGPPPTPNTHNSIHEQMVTHECNSMNAHTSGHTQTHTRARSHTHTCILSLTMHTLSHTHTHGLAHTHSHTHTRAVCILNKA